MHVKLKNNQATLLSFEENVNNFVFELNALRWGVLESKKVISFAFICLSKSGLYLLASQTKQVFKLIIQEDYFMKPH